MTSNNSLAQFTHQTNDRGKKSYERCFPGLTLPSSQNPFEEVALHKQLSQTFDDLKSKEFSDNSIMSKNKESLNDKVISDQNVTPTSQKQKPSDVKRWASVVKAQKKLQLSAEIDVNDKNPSEDEKINSETFPKSFGSHKGFFVINENIFYCNICCLKLDSVLSLSNHLKTRKHEDNAIEYFRSNIPVHLHNIMEFVSFHESNLCCNLCQCKISMSSRNAHETIVNIMGHNGDEYHISKKMSHEVCNNAESILQTLSASSSVISENSLFIEGKMVPEFKCKLCKTFIKNDDDKEALSQNFISHLESVGHIKNQKAAQVLKLFGEASITGKSDKWIVVNGNIMCPYCNREIETNLQRLISHVNDVEHASNVLQSKLKISSNSDRVSENNTLQENFMNEAISIVQSKPKKGEFDEKQSLEPLAIQSKPGCRLKDLLSTMPSGLKDVDYVIENDKGSVTCLICNRVVPPSTYNLRTHLLGNRHKMNMELRNEVAVGEPKKICASTLGKNPNSQGSMTDQNNYSLNASSKLETKLVVLDVKRLGFVLKTKQGIATCAICQYPFQNPILAAEHLASDEHKKRENLWSKNCPGCSSRNPFTFRLLKKLPTFIRTYKCRQMETIPASVLDHLYGLLLKENQLVKKNENFLVKNVDGKHSYCSLCKTLISLSLDLDILESNVVSHLKEKRHIESFTVISRSAQDVPTLPEVARSLFDLPDEFLQARKNTNVYNFEGFSRLICKDTSMKTNEELPKSFTTKVIGSDNRQELQGQKEAESNSLENEVGVSSVKEVKKDEVFVFGEDDMSLKKPKSANGALPVADVSHFVKFEEETSEEVLNRRQKQIEYGKNTEGYNRYCNQISRRKRGIYHPITPPKHLRCSRRTWDGMIRAWRRQLHAFDPPPSTVESDIRPLD